MGVGADIKEALQDVGVSVTILRDSGGDVEGEYLQFKPNSQVTKPFIKEFFLETLLSYDTEGMVGHRVRFEVTQDVYLLMNKGPRIAENEVIGYDSILYKCNVSGELMRASGEFWSTQTYHKETVWQIVKEEAFALQTEPLFGHDLETDEELGNLGLERHELYIPSSYGVQVLDRYRPFSGEYYRVETVRKRRFAGIDVVELGEDTR